MNEVVIVSVSTTPFPSVSIKLWLVPVFPEEKLLLELLLQKRPGEFENCSVWASNSRYYVDGKQYAISSETFKKADTEEIIKELEKNKFLVERQSIGYDKFEKNINIWMGIYELNFSWQN